MTPSVPTGQVTKSTKLRDFEDGSCLYEFYLSNREQKYTCRLTESQAASRMPVGSSIMVTLHPDYPFHAASVMDGVPLAVSGKGNFPAAHAYMSAGHAEQE